MLNSSTMSVQQYRLLFEQYQTQDTERCHVQDSLVADLDRMQKLCQTMSMDFEMERTARRILQEEGQKMRDQISQSRQALVSPCLLLLLSVIGYPSSRS